MRFRLRIMLFLVIISFFTLVPSVFANELPKEESIQTAVDNEVNKVEEYTVVSPQPKMSIYRYIWFPYAEIGFYRMGNFIPIGIAPTVAMNLSPYFVLSVGAGAGYRKQNTQDNYAESNDYYVTRDEYALWLAQMILGFEWYRTIPHFGIYTEFKGVFHGIDTVMKGNPVKPPLFEGVFTINPYYRIMTARDLLVSGWGVGSKAKFYTSGFYSVEAESFYGTDPFAEVRNKNGKHMFAMVYNSTVLFKHIGAFNSNTEINNFIRSDYKFSIPGGHTIDKPFSMYWINTLKMTGPMMWEFRFYARLFVTVGATWGSFYYDRTNNRLEWGLSVGLDVGIAIHDYVGGAISIRCPVEHLRPSLNEEKWSVKFSFDVYLEQV